jgi:PAS domain S-box-containing protein
MVRSQARLGALLKHANDIVVFADLDGRLVDCNEAAVKAYGYERTELLKLGLADLREPSARERLNGDLARLRAQAVLRMEAQHVRKDGTVFPVEVVANVASAGPDVFIVGVIRDISERRQSEARIQLLNRLLRTISGINQLIVRERTRERLLDEVCRAIVEQGELRMAWVGFTDEQTGWVRPVAWAGLSEDYLRGIRIRWDESPLGRGPTGTAIREGHPVIANDFDNDERLVPWREQARAQGFRASAAFPLTGDGKVLGALNVYATEPGFFGAEIVSLLDELAGDLGFALDAIGAREAQQSSERKLQESEARLRAIYESSADAIGVSKAGTQVMVNPAYAAMFGYERPEDLQGRSILELIAPSSREVVRDLVERRARGEPVPSTYGARGLRRDGSELDMEVRVSTYTHLGELFALVVLRDITERRRAEAALAESEARYRITAEMTGKLVYDYDVASGQVAWQGAISRLTGFTHEEFQAVDIRLWEEMIHPDDRERAIGLLDEAARGDGNYSVRYRFRRKDGSHIHVSDEGVFLKDATGRAVRMFGTMGDVTGEVVLEAQLRQAQKMEAVGNLAGGVAHDFNNLLQAILSLVEVLKAQQDDPARAAERLRELEENVRRGAQFTRQLLLFSRREATKREVLDLNAVLHGAAGMMRRLLRENIAVKLELAPGELPVEADRGQLEQVVANLSLNAADAMPDGGTVAISSGAEERGVWFEVTDTGSGIEESIRDRIFEPFFTTKGSGKGTGLGLSVVHGIVTGHGGSIELTSAVGEGSRFRITLTRAARHRDDSCGLVSEFPDALAAGWGELVLVVEDEPGAREGLREILTLLGYRATAVGSGEEALALPDEPAFDLLLTDVMLPGNPGPEVARLLRERWPALEVILMSGYAEDVAVRRIVTMGHVNFLQKPFDMATLAREIRAALKR